MPKGNAATVLLFTLAIVGAYQFYRPAESLARSPFARIRALPLTTASLNAFGASGEVRLRFALPAGHVEFPLEVSGEPGGLRYQWIGMSDTTVADSVRPLAGPNVVAPSHPGFYRLSILGTGERRVMQEPTLAVLVPFERKKGGWLNGYRIGTYLSERFGNKTDRPDGFLEVHEEELGMRVSKHFELADFITHDQNEVWPKYVALDPRLLDKLELVLEKIRETNSTAQRIDLTPDVHSGFRTPAHNAGVQRAARDSRHQYGDAADVAIDVDGDGRVTSRDETIIERAVNAVEDEHPDLVGGMGLYTSQRYRTPYVHIDARGRRSRWRG